MECCRISLLKFNYSPTIKAHLNASASANASKFAGKNERPTCKLVKMGMAMALTWQLGSGNTFASQFGEDPIPPFTLYGSISKKYCIEKLVDGKVIGRKKGVTANVCVNALEASRETPELQRLPIDIKVNIIGDPSCEKGEGQTKEDSCMVPCRKACDTAISHHLEAVKKETGYVLVEKDKSKVVDSCSTRCFNECLKSGKRISFVYPYRPPW